MAEDKKTEEGKAEERIQVVVVVPARAQFDGTWAIGKKWPTGNTEAEVTRKEFEALQRKPGIAVVEKGAATPAPGSAAPATPPASTTPLPSQPVKWPTGNTEAEVTRKEPVKDDDEETSAKRSRR